MKKPIEKKIELDKLSKGKSHWKKRAIDRKNNKHWLKKSRAIAFRILDELKEKGKTQVWLAQEMGIRPQQVNKWVRGSENFTLETIANLEKALGIELMNTPNIPPIKVDAKGPVGNPQYFSTGKSVKSTAEYSQMKLVTPYGKTA